MGTVDYDSIMTHPALSPVAESDLFAAGALMAERDVGGVPRPASLASTEWGPLTMLLLLGVLVYIGYRHSDFISFRIRQFFSSARQFVNANTVVQTWEIPYNLVLLLVGAACFGIMLSGLFHRIPVIGSMTGNIFLQVSLLSLFFLLAVILKSLIYELIGWVFFSTGRNRTWQSDYFFLTSITSYAIYLFTALLLFVGVPFEIVAICMLVLLILYKLLLFYRLQTNFQPKRYGVLLIFLYFCSVELMPTLVLWHFCDKSNIIF